MWQDAAPATDQPPGAAEPPVQAGPAIQLTVPLTLNGRYVGDVTVEVTPTGEASVRPADIAALLDGKVQRPVNDALRAQGTELTTLDALGSDALQLSFDAGLLELSATVASDRLSGNLANLSGQALPEPDAFYAPAPFAAYAEFLASRRYLHNDGAGDARFEGFNIAAQGAVTFGGFNGVTLIGGGDLQAGDNRFGFRDVALIKDFYRSAIRVQAGELDPQVVGFQSAARLLGLGIGRRYQDIQPFRNIRPSGRRAFILERPSTVEVYVNDQLVRTLELPAGPLTLDDLPLVQGANDVRLAILDATGQRSTIAYSAALQPILLAPGLTDFSLAIGYTTRDLFEPEGKLRATGFYYHGFDEVTLGTSFQASEDAVQAGLLASLGGSWGALSAQGAMSKTVDGGRRGWALALDYTGDFDLGDVERLTMDATLEVRSAAFADFNQPLPRNDQAVLAALTASYQLSATTSISFGGFGTVGRGAGPDTLRLNAGMQHQRGNWAFSAFATHSVTQNSRDDTRVSLQVTRRIGASTSASVRYEPTEGRVELEASRFAQRELGALSGRIRYGFDDRDSDLQADVDYFGNRLFANLTHGRAVRVDDEELRRTNQFTQLSVNTSIGLAGGQLAFGRGGGSGGFTIVKRHKTLKNSQIDILQGSRRIARTDGLGPVLIPLDRPYAVTRQTFSIEDLPAGYDIGTGEVDVFPGFFDAYAITIGSDASRTVLGTMIDEDGEPVALAVGELRGEGRAIQFFTNQGGRFVAERVAPGNYGIFIKDTLVGEITVKEEQEGLVDAGTVTITRP